MIKEMFKTKFRAIMNVSGKEFTFTKSGVTPQAVINDVKEEGMSVKNILRIETFETTTEKRRGKTARKY